MKYFFSALLIIPVLSFSQTQDIVKPGMSANDIKTILEDGYTNASGWTIKKGDTLFLGKGSLPSGSYSFIYESPTASANIYSNEKNYLKSYEAKYAIIKDLFPYGSKKSGFTIMAKVGVSQLVNYWIEIDAAFSAGEIVSPGQSIQPKKQSLSIADELKKWKDLLDTGAITKEEYEIQKNKLLKQ